MRPYLIRIPIVDLPVYSYGVMLMLSLVVGWYIVLGLCERDGMDREKMGKLYVWTAGCSVAASRLLYVFTNWDRFDNLLDVFKVWQGGMVAYGGFIGGFLCGIVYCRIHNIRLLSWADCVVPSLGTGLAITRIGCFLYGCDFGKPADVAWAVRFPKGSPAYAEQLKQHLIDATATHSLPVHPAQLYESLNGLVLFGLTMLVRRYRKFSGEMFCAFTMGYAVLRFFVETLRADEQRGEIGPLSTSQFIGIVTFVLAGGLLVYLVRRYRRDPKSIRYWELPPPGTAPAPVAAAPVRKRRRR
jgi:phosphatidylglycerol:prolipoprotein diacylglycerol transferase